MIVELAQQDGARGPRAAGSMIEGFNPKITLTRTQTIMEGATHCDFRFRSASSHGDPLASSAPARPTTSGKER